MAEQMWTKAELLKSLDDEVTIEKLRDFIPKLLSRLYVEGLSYGNMSSQGEVQIEVLIAFKENHTDIKWFV